MADQSKYHPRGSTRRSIRHSDSIDYSHNIIPIKKRAKKDSASKSPDRSDIAVKKKAETVSKHPSSASAAAKYTTPSTICPTIPKVPSFNIGTGHLQESTKAEGLRACSFLPTKEYSGPVTRRRRSSVSSINSSEFSFSRSSAHSFGSDNFFFIGERTHPHSTGNFEVFTPGGQCTVKTGNKPKDSTPATVTSQTSNIVADSWKNTDLIPAEHQRTSRKRPYTSPDIAFSDRALRSNPNVKLLEGLGPVTRKSRRKTAPPTETATLGSLVQSSQRLHQASCSHISKCLQSEKLAPSSATDTKPTVSTSSLSIETAPPKKRGSLRHFLVKEHPLNLNNSSSHKPSQAKTKSRSTSEDNHFLSGTVSYNTETVPPRLDSLRRSTRLKSTTGSCASSSGRRASSVSKRTEAPVAGGPTNSQSNLTASRPQSGASVMSNENSQGTSASCSQPSASDDVASVGASTTTSGAAAAMATGESEPEEPDMGRLHALLEARGLPPHLFGALGPRMQHLLHRSMSGVTKAQQLLQGIQSSDEGAQLTAVIEMCQLLVMGNEDTLAGFPIKQVVPALITLLQMEHNFDMMNHACRALTYMMEALPRSSAIVVDAVPTFLEKLQVIQCMDVAEQALTALEMLSRRHSKSILQAGGIAACLMYLDFFSINAQRCALTVAANACQSMNLDEFHYAKDSLPLLSTKLTQQDKKSVESTCLCFCRLVDNFQTDERLLKELAVHGLLTNIQQLLIVSPPIISTGTFVMVIRMLAILCSNAPDLAVLLLKQNIAETLLYLLVGSSDHASETVELVSRSPQELYEIVCLIGELLPILPSTGIFSVNSLLLRGLVSTPDGQGWQWKDDRGIWHSYSDIDSKIIESAYQAAEDEACLSVMGRSYTIDFNSMQQVNEDTGTARSIQKKATSSPSSSTAASSTDVVERCDSRAEILKEDEGLALSFIKTLFAVLYEVYSSSAGPSVRHKCLQTILRMVYYSSAELLQDVLKNHPISSHIAAMLASSDLKVVVGAMQMALILMEKLPDVFNVFFRREGVMHQVRRLADPVTWQPTPQKPSIVESGSCESLQSSTSLTSSSTPGTSSRATTASSGKTIDSSESASSSKLPREGSTSKLPREGSTSKLPREGSTSKLPREGSTNKLPREGSTSKLPREGSTSKLPREGSTSKLPPESFVDVETIDLPKAPGSPPTRLSEVLKRKKPPRRTVNKRNSKDDSCPSSGESTSSVFAKLGAMGRAAAAHTRSKSNKEAKVSTTSKSSFLSNLNPSRWGRSPNTSSDRPQVPKDLKRRDRGKTYGFYFHEPTSTSLKKSASTTSLTNSSKEKVRSWIKERACKFKEDYFNSTEEPCSSHPALNVLQRLSDATEALESEADMGGLKSLKEISSIMKEGDVSPFEIIHSGFVCKLLKYLTSTCDSIDRELRIRRFLHVFLDCPLPEVKYLDKVDISSTASLTHLVSKLMGCVHQLEQFSVKVHDLPGGSSTGGRGSNNALKFFNTHQLKCYLQRHPECTNLRQWRGGPVKIDPLALTQAIEKYLIMRGYSRIREDADDAESDDDNSDDDLDDTMAAVFITQGTTQHKLEFLMGSHVLPYNMTVYQAIKQFGHSDGGETDTDNEAPFGAAGIWAQTHTIWYRPAPDSSTLSTSSNSGSAKKSKAEGKSRSPPKKKGDGLWIEGQVPRCSPLDGFLTASLPGTVTVQDASLEVVALLRVLYALNTYWGTLFQTSYLPVLLNVEFLSSKLTAKANRQLQDPLVIMTGNLPKWLSQLGASCSFLLPFDTRQLLFYATSFDRDRAMMRLQDNVPDNTATIDSSERVAPRLDKRKRVITRTDLLKQAEKILDDVCTTKALLEIQYENEVGTGLGPTLEFYTLVSKEFQRADLDMWRGDIVSLNSEGSDCDVSYVHSPCGLFPAPLARNAKTSLVNKVKSKFKLLGKFLAKAVMDSRMVDIPLSRPFFMWTLGYETTLEVNHMHFIDPIIAQSFGRLQQVLHEKRKIENDQSHTPESRQLALDNLTTDGATIDDLGLDFVMPGYPHIELKKGGKDLAMTLLNLQEYIDLVSYWTLVEGVRRQFAAFREGFESVFPISHLNYFYPYELEQVFCGNVEEAWDVRSLMECCRPDHGYTHDSKAVQALFEILCAYTQEEQRRFLQFVTGSPRLPVGGFKSLSPPLTIVRKTFEDANENPDNFLPSVMTCVNYLKLPDYSTMEVMRDKLQKAAQEGQLAFHLS